MNETKIENNNKLDEEYEINHIDSWYAENSTAENSNSEINDRMDQWIKNKEIVKKKISHDHVNFSVLKAIATEVSIGLLSNFILYFDRSSNTLLLHYL